MTYQPAPPLPRSARHAVPGSPTAYASPQASAPAPDRLSVELDHPIVATTAPQFGTTLTGVTTASPSQEHGLGTRPGATEVGRATAMDDTQPIRLRVHAEIPRPNAVCVEVARRSFWLLGDVDQLSQRFDARLLCLTFRAEEALRRHFPRDGERFVTALLRPIEALGAEHQPAAGDDAESQLRQLGAKLFTAGMDGEDYGFIGLSLVRAIRDSYSGEWSTKLGSAWSEIHNWLVPQLEAGARAGRLAQTERTLGARVMHV